MQTTTAEKLNDLRQRYLNGEPWTTDELREAIRYMLEDRLKAQKDAAPKRRAKTPTVKVDLDDLLIEGPKEEAPKTDEPNKPKPAGFF